MKKVLKDLLKWLLIVLVSFQFVFMLVYAINNGGPVEAIYYGISTADKPLIYSIESSELEEFTKTYQEFADEAFKREESENEKIIELVGLYKKYPVGTVLALNYIGEMDSTSELYVVSLLLGALVGTVIFIIIGVIELIKQKKSIKNQN